MILDEIYSNLEPHTKDLGKLVIAGGAPRDVLLGNFPKDIDCFILTGQGNNWDFNKAKEETLSKIETLTELPSTLYWHRSEPYLVKNIIDNDYIIQIMTSPLKTVEELLDSFDWNVSLFAYDGNKFFMNETPGNIGPGKELKLFKVTYPISTMRRGFRFSERFKMKFSYKDIYELSKIISN